ncbi:type 4 pilus major pilin [Burkholderia sp. Ac-20384]|uniref:type 4 pilus major pilin n=1 Tax=Burkholderia sp. Ac-20384 TaxID=2703902 RepID=UPI003216B3E8
MTIGNPVAPKLRRSRHRQRGASLLEAIAYLGIAAIVVIGAVALLNSAFNSAGTNQLSEQVSAIQTGVKKLYMGQSTGYTDVSNAVLQSAGVFPSTVSVTGSGTSATATNNWGGAVSVTGTATSFSIEYDNVPASVCVNAVVSGGSWSSIQIGGTTETTLPISPAKAATDCGASGSTTITWTSV